MTNSTSKTKSNRKGLKAVFLAFLLVLSLPAMTISFAGADHSGIASAQESSDIEYSYDFENGTMSGWTAPDDTSSDPTNVDVVSESFWGNYSLRSDEPSRAIWESGRTFSSQENFEVSGTFKTNGSGSGVNLGLMDPEGGENWYDERATIRVDYNANEIHLTNGDHTDDSKVSDQTIDQTFEDQWVQFRLRFDGGQMYAKVWEAGTGEPANWQLTHDAPQNLESKFIIAAGGGSNDRTILLDQLDAGSKSISGQVVDQNGDPVSNATVEAVGVDYDRLNDSIENKQAEAERLLSEAENPLPDAWNPETQLTGSNGEFAEASGKYIAVHTTDNWQLGGSQLPGTEYNVNVDPQLGEPALIAPNDDTLILSMWDATDTGGLILDREDAADNDLTGRTTSGTIVIEQISPTGEVVDKTTRDTQEYVTLNPSLSFSTKTHEAVAVDLPNNQFYRVYPEGNKGAAYVFSRGNPEEIGYALTQDLKTEAGELTERARSLQSNIEGGIFRRVTTTTNETGHYEIRTLDGVQTASVQAYKADGKLLLDITGPSINDLRTAHERGYNGSVSISPSPTRVAVPSEDNTIRVIKSPTPPFGNMEDYEDILSYLQDELRNSSTSMLESLFSDELGEVDLDELQDRHEVLLGLFESNDELADRLEDLLGNDEINTGDEKSRAELIEELEAMDRAIADLEKKLEAGVPDSEIDGDEIYATFPFAGDLDSDAVSVVLHYQNGTSKVIPEEFWTVESTSLLGGDQVVVNGFPISDQTAVADVEVTGVSEDGLLGSSRTSLVNPAFDGDVPSIDAIDVSTLRPGVNERVKVSLRTDDSSFGGVEDVTVYGPEGTVLETTLDDGIATFAPQQTGVHSIRVTYTNRGGTNFVQSVKIAAKQNPTSDPPTVRIADGLGGPIAIAGDQLESASVKVDGNTADIVAQAPGDETPTNLDVRAEVLSVDTTNVRVVRGSNQQSVNKHVSVRMFVRFGTAETLIYRGAPSAPITNTSATKFGTWTTAVGDEGDSQRVIETYSDANGEVTIDTSRNPGIIERIIYRVSIYSPIDLPFSSVAVIPVPTTVGATASSAEVIA